MTTITVTNSNDTGAGSLRAAVAEAGNGDTIDFADNNTTGIRLGAPLVISKNITIDGYISDIGRGTFFYGAIDVQAGASVTLEHLSFESSNSGLAAADNAQAGDDGSPGADGNRGKGGDGDGGQDATMSNGVATNAGPSLENDGTLTLSFCDASGIAVGNGAGGSNPGADGADGGNGGDGGKGDTTSSGSGAVGGIGGDGGAGSNGTNGGDEVGGVINTGKLTIIDSTISGEAIAGDGGAGGDGGDAGNGGAGGAGAPPGAGSAGGVGGKGGNGGSGGDGGAGGKGGSAVGGIVNTGTVTIIGAAILYGDSAQAGAAGAGGTGGAAGIGGAGGSNGSGGSASSGMDGDDGAAGASGVFGTETDDYLDKGTTTGTFTINHYFYDFVTHGSGQPSSVDTDETGPVTFSYEVGEFGGYYAGFPDTGSVGWKVVAGAGGPPAGDFVGPTTGVLSYSANQSGEFLGKFVSVQLKGDASAAQNETFTIELFNPSTGGVLGSVDSIVQQVVNTTVGLPNPATVAQYQANKAAYDALGSFAIVDTEANVANGLAALEADQAHISSVTATGAPLLTYASNFVADEAVLNKVVGNFGVLGNASALNPILGQLNADLSHINTITALSGTVTATVATFTADKAALDKIGSFAIVDTEANVANGLAALEADQAHITTVTATGAPLVTYASSFVADEAVLNKVVGNFEVLGNAVALNPILGQLNADLSHITSIAVASGTVTATVATFTADKAALDKIGSFAIVDTEANVANGLAALEADQAHITTVTATGAPLVTYASNFVADEAVLNKVVGNFEVLGNAVALNPILGQLNADLSHITSIAVASGTVTATVATFTADKAALDKIGSFAIVDTEANVANGLAALEADQAHITTVTATGAPLLTYASSFVADEAVLNKVVGNFEVLGNASALNPILGQLNADLSHITSIAVASGTVTATVATFTADKAALDKIGSFAIVDTEANVANGLAALEADQAHITTVTATGAPLLTYASNFVADEAVLNKVVGNFEVLGNASAVTPILNTLEADVTHITSVVLADATPPTLNITQAQATSDASLLAKIAGSYVLNVANTNGSTTTTGHGTAALTINAAATGPDTLTGNSGADAFIFKPAFGQDVITNFNGSDTITLPASEFGSFATLLMHQSGADTLITNTHNADTLTLHNITETTLTSGEFKFA